MPRGSRSCSRVSKPNATRAEVQPQALGNEAGKLGRSQIVENLDVRLHVVSNKDPGEVSEQERHHRTTRTGSSLWTPWALPPHSLSSPLPVLPQLQSHHSSGHRSGEQERPDTYSWVLQARAWHPALTGVLPAPTPLDLLGSEQTPSVGG